MIRYPNRIRQRVVRLLAAVFIIALATLHSAEADAPPFDLPGPALVVNVTRGAETLPLSSVPSLAAGDRLSIAPKFAEQTSARFLVVLAFLRSAVSPPPAAWFSSFDSWRAEGKGFTAIVPEGATQAVLFLVPAKNGDFATLRGAVQGQPGAFLRAGRNLALASLDRQRLNTFLDQLAQIDKSGDPDVARKAPILAANLHLKLSQECLTKPRDEQVACLGAKGEELVLEDGHAPTLAEQIAGPGADLAQQVTATSVGGIGAFNPYVGLVREIAQLFSTVRSPRLQYIPALMLADHGDLRLLLNRAPSFHSPRSVMVAALPPIEPAPPPAIEGLAGTAAICAQAARNELPARLAPQFYSTGYAHDLKLVARLGDDRTLTFPVTANVLKGGLLVERPTLEPIDLPPALAGKIQGKWGFATLDEQSVTIESAAPWNWRVVASPVVSVVKLSGPAPACVTGVSVIGKTGDAQPAKWKLAGPGEIEVELPAESTRGAAVRLVVSGPQAIAAQTIDVAFPKPSPRQLQLLEITAQPSLQQQRAGLALPLTTDRFIVSDSVVRLAIRANDRHHFEPAARIEVEAGLDGSDRISAGVDAVALLDPSTAIVSFVPEKLLGPGAYGKLRLRARLDGRDSDWLELGQLVRLPVLSGFTCSTTTRNECQISGARLYLLDSVAADTTFVPAMKVPFATLAATIPTPRPVEGKLYLRLHDAPGETITLRTPSPQTSR